MYTRTYSTFEGDFELVAPCDQRRFNRSKLGSVQARRWRDTQKPESRVVAILCRHRKIMTALTSPRLDKIKEVVNKKYGASPDEINELKPRIASLAKPNPRVCLPFFVPELEDLHLYSYVLLKSV